VRLAITVVASFGAACGARTGLEASDTSDADDEVCNGLDDDGDGRIDEDVPSQACGTGACAREAPGCTDGDVPPCEPGSPSPETCNGIDDDCDGSIDEGLGFGPRGEPIAIRIDEGETGDCTSCRWAAETSLFYGGNGFVAVWRLGFDGMQPMPNTFSRAIDLDGTPRATARVLWDPPVSQGFRMAPTSGGRAVLAFCLRDVADDVPSSAFLDADGALLEGPTERSPRLDTCGGQVPDVVWTGRRHLFSWVHDHEGPALEVADEEGRSLSFEVLDRDRVDGGIRLSNSGGRVLQVFVQRPEPAAADLVLRTLDDEGNLLGEAMARPEVGRAVLPVVAPATPGWLVLAENDVAPGIFALRIDEEGDIVSGPTLLDESRTYANDLYDLEPRPGGGFYFVATVYDVPYEYYVFVATLDDEGRIEEEWATEPFSPDGKEGWIASPDLVAVGGSVFLLYKGLAPNSEPNRIWLREFGCTP